MGFFGNILSGATFHFIKPGMFPYYLYFWRIPFSNFARLPPFPSGHSWKNFMGICMRCRFCVMCTVVAPGAAAGFSCQQQLVSLLPEESPHMCVPWLLEGCLKHVKLLALRFSFCNCVNGLLVQLSELKSQ